METNIVIIIPIKEDIIKELNSNGYERRSGNPSYHNKNTLILPHKKWYWLTNDSCGIYFSNQYD